MEGLKQFTCKTCGAVLVKQGSNYFCQTCGNVWISDVADDVHAVQRANAWEALRVGDFERAVDLFAEILIKDKNNHEAYWGKALSLNAILYVVDTNENKRVPTCNNITENSFLNSSEVQKAIALAPAEIAENYKKQAEYIEKVRIEWLKKASQEPEYDVFISFKDSDREHGIERTQDSKDAQELCSFLQNEGYKVFFSRISLKNKVAEQYEPYIYNAIKTAKIMIVFGEKVEYFTAPWIKNEWKRYLDRIERGEKHKNSLVVVYKDINVGDLPKVLSSKQCLNYKDMSFSYILLSHIKRIIEEQKKVSKLQKIEIKGGQIAKKATSLEVNEIKTRELGGRSVKISINEEQQLKLIETYIKRGMLFDAEQDLNAILLNNPENGEAIYRSLQLKYTKKPASAIIQADLLLLEKAISNCDKEHAKNILNSLYQTKIKDEFFEVLLKTILPFEYEDRQKQIGNALENCIENGNFKSFSLLLKALKGDEVDYYINYNLRFCANSSDENAKLQCINNVLSVDAGNVTALTQKLNIYLGRNENDNYIKCFEEVLKYSKTPENEILNAIKLIESNFSPSHGELVKKILSYSTNEPVFYKNQISKIVKKLIEVGNFNMAEELLLLITAENEQDAQIYWLLCLIKLKAKSEKEIVNCQVPISSLSEFKSFLLFASEKEKDNALNISQNQNRAIANKKQQEEEARRKAEEEARRARKIKITLVSIISAIAVLVITFFSYLLPLIYLKTGQYKKYLDYKNTTEITIPNGVTSIGNDAFEGCDSLTSVTIPDSVTSIGSSAFAYCDSLTSVTIPDSVTSIGSSAFAYCDSLTSVTIGNGVTSIGERAFYNCESLTSVTIGNGVTSIGERAFAYCYDLTSVIIPDSVTSIGSSAFAYCYDLTSVTIGNSVTSIGHYAFDGCVSLTNIQVDENNSNFKSIDGNLYNKDGTTLIQYAIGKTQTSFTIPDSVTSIGYSAFGGCSSLTSITFEDSSTWYITTSSSDWKKKTGGTQTSVTNPTTNATYFTDHSHYYWYKK